MSQFKYFKLEDFNCQETERKRDVYRLYTQTR